ncbi:protein of unknown function [Haloechinothrix alba]|uniref:DUF397 domain-containing protein n=1 Tax=Haloechinothrix alba TaxID=664784 RepID=A0A238XJZ9_9PSEU|nr:DUF397 domain-containing protein [Haloechinothrix alba]SNR59326.1 protein of unknown function [Haloechinothrix alba]
MPRSVRVRHWMRHRAPPSAPDENGHCVQVAVAGRSVGLRDPKDPAGGSLVLPSPAWNAFLDGLR